MLQESEWQARCPRTHRWVVVVDAGVDDGDNGSRAKVAGCVHLIDTSHAVHIVCLGFGLVAELLEADGGHELDHCRTPSLLDGREGEKGVDVLLGRLDADAAEDVALEFLEDLCAGGRELGQKCVFVSTLHITI